MAGLPQIDNDEINLGGVHFPIAGPVRVSNITVTPNPILFGDASKQSDTQIMSSFVQSSNTGGAGIYKADPRTDIDRFWYSDADTRFRNYFTLPPESVNMSKPSGLTTEAVSACLDFNNEQYFAWANKIYRWLDTVSGWSSVDRTLASPPTDVITFLGKMYWADTISYDVRDSAGVWTTVATPVNYWAVWDTKLWRLALVSGVWTIYYSLDGSSWSAAVGTLPSGLTPQQMIVYRDAGGNNVIIVLTDRGLYLYDSANVRFLESEVRWPQVISTQSIQATVFRDGKMYVNCGDLGMLSVAAGDPFVVTPMGLDLEDGVPAEENGVFDATASDINWMLAMAKATAVTDSDDRESGLGMPFDTMEWTSETGIATLRAWNQGWHTLWKSSATLLSESVIAVSSAYGQRRIYWGSGQAAYYMNIPTGVYNPRHNPTSTFAAGPVTHVTPWFDFGSSVQQKILGEFLIRTTGCSATEKVTVYYGTDLDDTTWNLLGTITTNGLLVYHPGSVTGAQCRFARFRFDLQRGSNNTLAPLVEFWSSEFMKLLPATYGYVVDIDLTKTWKGKTPAQLLKTLKDLSDPRTTPNLLQFSYQDMLDSGGKTHYARVSRLQGQEWSGKARRGEGYYTLSLMVPYAEDSIVGG